MLEGGVGRFRVGLQILDGGNGRGGNRTLNSRWAGWGLYKSRVRSHTLHFGVLNSLDDLLGERLSDRVQVASVLLALRFLGARGHGVGAARVEILV